MKEESWHSLGIRFTNGSRINLNRLKNQIDRKLLKINLITDQIFSQPSQPRLKTLPSCNKDQQEGNNHPSKERNVLTSSYGQQNLQQLRSTVQNSVKQISSLASASKSDHLIHLYSPQQAACQNQEQKTLAILNSHSNKISTSKEKYPQVSIPPFELKNEQEKENSPQKCKKLRRRPKTDRFPCSDKSIDPPKFISNFHMSSNVQQEIKKIRALPQKEVDCHLRDLLLKQTQKITK